MSGDYYDPFRVYVYEPSDPGIEVETDLQVNETELEELRKAYAEYCQDEKRFLGYQRAFVDLVYEKEMQEDGEVTLDLRDVL